MKWLLVKYERDKLPVFSSFVVIKFYRQKALVEDSINDVSPDLNEISFQSLKPCVRDQVVQL